MNVSKTIYDLLTSDATVSGYVGTKVYPAITSQKIASPYIIYNCYNTEPTDTKDGSSTLDILYFIITAFHKNPLTAVDISNSVRAALDRFTGANSGNNIDKIIFVGQDGPDFDEETELFSIDLDIRVRARVDYGDASGNVYMMTVDIYVNDVLDSTIQINPVIDNIVNIEP